jgi:hypothetical protein
VPFSLAASRGSRSEITPGPPVSPARRPRGQSG